MTAIVFSRDRAAQLDAFLRSWEHHVAKPIKVLYRSTTDRHAQAYAEALGRHVCNDVRENNFRDDVLRMLLSADKAVFFVDDQIFTHPWDGIEEVGLSLRLGLNLKHCYTRDQHQALPPFSIVDPDQVRWRWAEGTLDWGYPLSVDGNVYDAAELRQMLLTVEWTNPNQLEQSLQAFRGRFDARYGLCFQQSRVVNVPWNRVQTEFNNRCAWSSDPDMMLDCWEAGQQIALEHIYGFENKSCHQEFPLILEPRC